MDVNIQNKMVHFSGRSCDYIEGRFDGWELLTLIDYLLLNLLVVYNIIYG